jgi:misacylated tRNA(Ala) deacylase
MISATEKLFWKDAYMKEFDSVVTSVNANRVILDRTAFNPRGGGLVSDIGTINEVGVEEVVKEQDEIVHVLTQGSTLPSSAPVHGKLDWERRYRTMKMHTSAHILSAVVNKETGGLITGNQISSEESRIDFSLDNFDRNKLADYVSIANEAVARGLEVKTYFMGKEEALKVEGLVKLANAAPPDVDVLRIVQIGDLDIQADGGVHVANTKEIGEIVVTKAENKGKSNRRIYYKLC